jgi:hypothetical protein
MAAGNPELGLELSALARISERAASLISRQKEVVVASHVDATASPPPG